MITLIDGTGKNVTFARKAIESAVLGMTNIVTLKGNEDVNIAYFNSDDGDEIDVSNGHSQDVYEPDKIKEAIVKFMELCEKNSL